MKSMKNQRGSVLVFATLMIVLLLVMVGIGLDTGWITYVRGLGQPAVDAAALAGASALPTGIWSEVENRVAAFNATNDYVKSGGNPITKSNVTGVVWDSVTGVINKATGPNMPNAVRVALEQTNPYGGSNPPSAINAPLFLTPLFNVLGISMPTTTNINVSAVAVLQGVPAMPIAIAGCPPVGACKNVTANGGTECTVAQYPAPVGGENSGWTSFTIKPAGPSTIGPMISEPATCGGKIPAVEVGTKICLNNGVATGPMYGGLQTYYGNNSNGLSEPDGKPAAYAADCGLVPVIDASVKSFNGCDNEIKSFAKLCIRDVIYPADPKYVYADITCNQILYNPYNTGATCFIPRLVREKKSAACPSCAM